MENVIDDSTKSCTLLTESLGDCSNATILAEYEVNKKTAVKNNTKITTLMDTMFTFIVYPGKNKGRIRSIHTVVLCNGNV